MIPKKIIIRDIFHPFTEDYIFNSHRDGAKWLYDQKISNTIEGGITSIRRVLDKEDVMYHKYVVRSVKQERE